MLLIKLPKQRLSFDDNQFWCGKDVIMEDIINEESFDLAKYHSVF